MATHLGLSIHERYAQAQALAGLVEPTRTIVLGDFNDWFWVKSVRRRAGGALPGTNAAADVSRHGCRCCGSTGSTPRRTAIMVKAWTDREARAYSDHLPVLADIGFSGA